MRKFLNNTASVWAIVAVAGTLVGAWNIGSGLLQLLSAMFLWLGTKPK